MTGGYLNIEGRGAGSYWNSKILNRMFANRRFFPLIQEMKLSFRIRRLADEESYTNGMYHINNNIYLS